MMTSGAERQGPVLPGQYVFSSTQQRTFKACRTCRQQKVRCQGADNPPCRRCQATGRDCVFDLLGSRKRQRPSQDDIETQKEDTSNSPREAASLPIQLSDTSEPKSSDDAGGSWSQHQGRESDSHLHWPERLSNSVNERIQPGFTATSADCTHPEDMNLLHLNAPITAVHALRPSSSSIASSSPQSFMTSTPSQPVTASTLSVSIEDGDQSSPRYDDVVSAGLISEAKARKLFHLYMANSNGFLPLFDPITDTFETIRKRSAFLLSAILVVALQVDQDSPNSEDLAAQCHAKAQAYAAHTLFYKTPRIEDIQGLLILAAYAETNWFAVAHAREMAEELQLQRCLTQLLRSTEGNHSVGPTGVSKKQLARMTRVSLVLHNVEREVASGTRRRPKLKPIDERSLRMFLENKFTDIFDIRTVSTIEITELRGHLLRDIEALTTVEGQIDEKLAEFEQRIEHWFKYWEEVYQEHEISVTSLYRTSLRIQRGYAFIILSSAMISKLGEELSLRGHPFRMTKELGRIIDITVDRSTQLLLFIYRSDTYKWNLQWAPTYSGLFAVFAAALIPRLSHLRPHAIDWSSLLPAYSAIADALQPRYPKYALILRSFVSLASDRISSRSPRIGPVESPLNADSPERIATDSNRNEEESTECEPMNSSTSLQDPQLAEFFGAEQQYLQSLQNPPHFMLNYDSFAASVAAYEFGCENILDYPSWNSTG